jgi:hypothetical protein
MYYCGVNRTSCCKKPICTECYLQVRSPQPRSDSPCPFCNRSKLQTTYGLAFTAAATADEEEKALDAEVEVVLLQERIMAAEARGEDIPALAPTPGEDEDGAGDDQSPEVLYSNAPLATVEDRRQMEGEWRWVRLL